MSDRDASIITPQPLQIDALMHAFRSVGRTLPTTSELYIDGDWGWVRISIDHDDEEPASVYYDDAEVIKIHAAMEKPCYAYFEYDNLFSADLVLNMLPVSEDALVMTSYGLLLTVAEIRQRIKHGIAWAIWAADNDEAELALDLTGEDFQIDLAVLEDARIISPAARELYLKRKLDWCVELATSNHGQNYGDNRKSRVYPIHVVYEHLPTKNMSNIRSVTGTGKNSPVLPVNFISSTDFLAQFGFSPRDLPSLRPGQPGRMLHWRDQSATAPSRAVLISAQVLDLQIIARPFMKLGEVERTQTQLRVSGAWGWFNIDVGKNDLLLTEFKNTELIDVCSVIGTPIFAELTYRDYFSADLAVRHFSFNGRVLIDNGMDKIMAIEEAQRRFQLGIEWRVWGGEFATADLIVGQPNDANSQAFVLVEDSRITDDVVRDCRIDWRLSSTAGYILGAKEDSEPNFKLDHPGLVGKKSTIEFVYAHSLTDKMKQIAEARYYRNQLEFVPVHFSSRAEFTARFGFDPTSFPSLRKV